MPGRSKRILVVIADGGAARFFECARIGGPVTEFESRRLEAGPPPEVTSRLPRVQDSFGPARHAIEPRQFPRDAGEERFLKQVAEAAGEGVDQFDEVVVCAAPRALGVLREHLPASVRQRLKAEFAKDFVKHAPNELSAALEAVAP